MTYGVSSSISVCGDESVTIPDVSSGTGESCKEMRQIYRGESDINVQEGHADE